MKTCAIRHREPVAAPTRCRKCGQRIDDPNSALCLDCVREELAMEGRAERIEAALAALDRMGEGGEP